VREENRIGSHCTLWNNSTIDYGCVIGDRVRIHCNVYIAQFTTLEDDVFLAPGVTIANDPHPICTKCMQGPTIRRGARIGVNVTLLPLITIGENALVGAGSVVTADVPPGMLVAGNPARIIGPVDSVECPFGIVIPYEHGLDVRRRPEWTTVEPLPRPVTASEEVRLDHARSGRHLRVQRRRKNPAHARAPPRGPLLRPARCTTTGRPTGRSTASPRGSSSSGTRRTRGSARR
jgi:carbonic anhydrase/acetyltransferase-like protein (isoleucine patch superfamily)